MKGIRGMIFFSFQGASNQLSAISGQQEILETV
jgi:hypothetical protein